MSQEVKIKALVDSEPDAVTGQLFFIYSSSVILLITGLAKIVSSFGQQQILGFVDPVTGIHFKILMLFSGILELSISAFCFFYPRRTIRIRLISWLGTILLLYRIGLSLSGWHRPCPCLGNFTDVIHISDSSAETLAMAFLLFFLIGGYGISLITFLKNKVPPVET